MNKHEAARVLLGHLSLEVASHVANGRADKAIHLAKELTAFEYLTKLSEEPPIDNRAALRILPHLLHGGGYEHRGPKGWQIDHEGPRYWLMRHKNGMTQTITHDGGQYIVGEAGRMVQHTLSLDDAFTAADILAQNGAKQ